MATAPAGAVAPPPAVVHTIPARVHGRYLVEPADEPGAAPLLVGFHGYGEHAESHLAELRRIPESGAWVRVAVQALHRHYSADRRHVVGSWMTRQDREFAIADNIAYIRDVVSAVRRDHATSSRTVFCGFSQGVAMAYRAARRAGHPCLGVIALAGDVPPELRDASDDDWPPVLVGRGTSDAWYTAEKMAADLAFLKAAGAAVTPILFGGGHAWTDVFREAAGRFLASVR